MDELKRNGSGYYDEAAYKAMAAAGKTNLSNVRRGDIIEIQMAKGDIREMAVIKCFNETMVGLLLRDREPRENCISIKSRKMMYADAGRLIYSQYDKVENYIRTISENDMEYILSCIGQAFDIHPLPQEPAEVPEHIATPREDELIDDRISTELAVTARERDIYERLYQDMLNRALGGGFGGKRETVES